MLARAARGGGGTGSWARPCCVRPSGRPLRRCGCSSRACWPSALCCTAVAERGRVQHKHHGCCWLVLVPVHHEQPKCSNTVLTLDLKPWLVQVRVRRRWCTSPRSSVGAAARFGAGRRLEGSCSEVGGEAEEGQQACRPRPGCCPRDAAICLDAGATWGHHHESESEFQSRPRSCSWRGKTRHANRLRTKRLVAKRLVRM